MTNAGELATCFGCCVEQLEKWRPLIAAETTTTKRDLEKLDSAIQWARALEKLLVTKRPNVG